MSRIIWIGLLVASVGAFDFRSRYEEDQRSDSLEADYSRGFEDSYHGQQFGRLDQDWGYEDEIGPNSWRAGYPRCAGYRQSPIALPSKPHNVVKMKKPLFKNYNELQPAVLINNGNSVELLLKGDKLPIQQGVYGLQKDRFKMYKLAFHWGKVNSRGAEHSIGGKQYCGEVQLFKYNAKYKSAEEALGRPDGIMVHSFLFKVSKKSNPSLDQILGKLEECSGSRKPVHVDINPKIWLPYGSQYYVYQGSLTTPPCTEKVTYAVEKEPLPISEKQLNALRRLKTPHGEDFYDNFRQIQPLNGRKITLVKRVDEGYGDQYEDRRTSDQYEDRRTSDQYDDRRTSDQYDDRRTSDQYEDSRTSDQYDDRRTSDQYDDRRTSDQYDDRRTSLYDDTRDTEYADMGDSGHEDRYNWEGSRDSDSGRDMFDFRPMEDLYKTRF